MGPMNQSHKACHTTNYQVVFEKLKEQLFTFALKLLLLSVALRVALNIGILDILDFEAAILYHTEYITSKVR